MASDFGYIEYLCDQLQGAGTITYRKMFGEYALYCEGTSILPPGEVLEVHLGLQDYAARPLRGADLVLVRPRGGLVFLA
jgi:hypothetical protein